MNVNERVETEKKGIKERKGNGQNIAQEKKSNQTLSMYF
jgi:hypothetical protein